MPGAVSCVGSVRRMMQRRLRVATASLVALVGLGALPVLVAHAQTDSGTWVPPSLVDVTGHDESGLLVGGQVSTGAGEVNVTRATSGGSYCTHTIDSGSWSAGEFTLLWHGAGGSYTSWCTPPTAVTPPSVVLWCLDSVSGALVRQSVNTFVTGGWVTGGRTYNLGCGSQGTLQAAAYSWDLGTGNAANDAFMSLNPALPAPYTVVVACSDGSNVSTTAAPGALIGAGSCPAGAHVTSITVTPQGATTPAGKVTPHADFPFSDCSTGGCVPAVAWAGHPTLCSVTDAGCYWWAGTDPATACAWGRSGTDPGAWTVVSALDCETARSHASFPDPGWTATAAASPTAGGTTVVVQPTVNVNVTVNPTVNVSVNVDHVNVSSDPQALGDCEPAGVSPFNPASYVVEPLKCLLIPSDYAMGLLTSSMCVPSNDPGQGSWCVASRDKMGTYSDRINEIGGYLNVPVPDCMGPAVPLYDLNHKLVTLYPLQSCVDPGRTLAAISFAGTTVLMYVLPFIGFVRVIASAFGIAVFNNNSPSGKGGGGESN